MDVTMISDNDDPKPIMTPFTTNYKVKIVGLKASFLIKQFLEFRKSKISGKSKIQPKILQWYMGQKNLEKRDFSVCVYLVSGLKKIDRSIMVLKHLSYFVVDQWSDFYYL